MQSKHRKLKRQNKTKRGGMNKSNVGNLISVFRNPALQNNDIKWLDKVLDSLFDGKPLKEQIESGKYFLVRESENNNDSIDSNNHEYKTTSGKFVKGQILHVFNNPNYGDKIFVLKPANNAAIKLNENAESATMALEDIKPQKVEVNSDNKDFPDNMAMFAGPSIITVSTKPIFPRHYTSDDIFSLIPGETYACGWEFYPKYLKSFPNINDFDIIRFVLMYGGTIRDDENNIIIEREPNSTGFYGHNGIGQYWPNAIINNIYKSANYYHAHYKTDTSLQRQDFPHSYEPIKWFIDNKQSEIIKLYNKYQNLFADPTLIQIGTITLNTNFSGRNSGTVPLMFPKIYRTSAYWKKKLEDFVKQSEIDIENQRSGLARSGFIHEYIIELND